MDFFDTPQDAAFRQDIRTFLATHTPAYFRDRHSTIQNYTFQSDQTLLEAIDGWRKTLGDAGYLAPHWPREYGGGGFSVMQQVILNEEMSWAHVPHPGGIGVGMAGPTIILHGSEAQKRERLPRILSGDDRWCQGFSEPGAGSDLASLQTRAVRDGDDFVVNGQKIWTSGAMEANWINLLVRTDPDAPKHKGITYLLAPMDSPGIHVRPLQQMTGHAHFNETFFEDVRVPVRNVVGEINRGWYVAMTTLDFERSGIGGAVEAIRSVQLLARYASESGAVRRTPSLRWELAERFVEATVARLLSLRVASMQDRGLVPNMEASAGKMYGSELRQRIANTAMKVAGLEGQVRGSTSETAQALAPSIGFNYLETVSATIAGGTSEVQRNIIATRGLGMPPA